MTPDPFSMHELAGWGSGHKTIGQEDEDVCHKCSEQNGYHGWVWLAKPPVCHAMIYHVCGVSVQ